MNIERLQQLVVHLKGMKSTPKAGRFNMVHWGATIGPLFAPEGMLEKPPCNTQACLAGEALLMLDLAIIHECGGLMLTARADDDYEFEATQALELSISEAARLFYPNWDHVPDDAAAWPLEFQERYDAATTPNDRLDVAIERVEHFIATNGAE